MKREYLEYLETPEWHAVRKQALARARYRCERCQGCGPLHVHHITYIRIGREYLDDLEVLCENCHRAERLPRNIKKRVLEQYGQYRLFDRWQDDDPCVMPDELDDAA